MTTQALVSGTKDFLKLVKKIEKIAFPKKAELKRKIKKRKS